MPSSNPGNPVIPDDLAQPATQIAHSRADYLGEGQADVGQRIADDRLELFVSADPASALQQQFARLKPEFIAIHDVGGSHSLRLLWSIAKALGVKLQHLAIRRQGQGVSLATLRFVDIPGQGARGLRLYTSDVDADTAARRQLANVLLGHSRLGVLMVGDLPAHAVHAALQPVIQAMRAGPWANRRMLLMPMGNLHSFDAAARELAEPRGVEVSVCGPARGVQQSWAAISDAWRGKTAAAKAVERRTRPRAEPPATPAGGWSSGPGTLAPPATASMPAPQPPQPAAASGELWSTYLAQCAEIKGMISACLVDFRAERSLGHVGGRPGPDKLADQAAALFAAMADASRTLGLGHAQPDASITLTGHHLILHPLPGHPGILLIAVLDAAVANLVLARMQLARVDTTVFGAPAR